MDGWQRRQIECNITNFCNISLIFCSGITIFVNVDCQYQSMLGFGGAFTHVPGINVKSLSANTRSNILESYYGNNGIPEHRMINNFIDLLSGIQYSMASCDLSTREYSYDDVDANFNLTHFTLPFEDL
jgi:glucosylceramidase